MLTLYILLTIFFITQGYWVCKELLRSVKAIADAFLDWEEKDGNVFWERKIKD